MNHDIEKDLRDEEEATETRTRILHGEFWNRFMRNYGHACHGESLAEREADRMAGRDG